MTFPCIEYSDTLREPDGSQSHPTILSPAVSAQTVELVPMWARDTKIACQNCRKSHARCETDPRSSDCKRCERKDLTCEPAPIKERFVVRSASPNSRGLQNGLHHFRLSRPLKQCRRLISPRHGDLQQKLHQHELVPSATPWQEEGISSGPKLPTPNATSVPRGYASELDPSDRHQKGTTQDHSTGPSFKKREKHKSGCSNPPNIPDYLDISHERIRQLLASYLRHDHALYPIFHKQRLEEHFRNFLRRYGHRLGLEQFQSSIGHCSSAAIVLLVLALGEMCMQNESNLASDWNTTQSTHEANEVYHSAPSVIPERDLPHATPHPLADTRSLNSMVNIEPNSVVRDTRTPFCILELHTKSKDRSTVPGSLYFEKAKQIWNLARSGDDLQVAQVHILAGLCAAHHAGMEAGNLCIKYAGDKLFDLLNRHDLLVDDGNYRFLERLQSPLPTGEPMYVAVKAAWTCLRLEAAGPMMGEFLPSRLRGAGILPLPFTLIGDVDQNGVILRDYHLAMISVEKIYHSLRNQSVSGGTHFFDWQQIYDQVDSCRGDLHHWRETLPPYLKWTVEDDVIQNALKARLRAKYHETLFHIYLPLLEYNLNIWPLPANGSNKRDIVGTGHSTLGSRSKIQFFESIDARTVDRILEAWALCLDAATSSIMSYHRTIKSVGLLRGQDVAYTAFEMIKALCAAYRGKLLRLYVDFRSLEVPYTYTIKILEYVGTHYELSQEACLHLKEIWFRTRDSRPQIFTHTNDP